MKRRYSITALCGMGLGTSSIARMAIMDYLKKRDIDASVTVADIGSVKGINSDVILTTKSMGSHIPSDIAEKSAVLLVTNLIKRDEIEAKLDEFFSTQNAD
ncbi:PTS sugar transporter subunit IIB [Olsenella massiliensis]|uniref:PTS sugar transporter subunit IIB n=1 Tax=Olsenella massiliensis TaxID=1622075 RepID=UPI00071DA148|nr:PTS sugar transporter subunit IIB [Olsenella massiliensis]